jgi:hypothetical protein
MRAENKILDGDPERVTAGIYIYIYIYSRVWLRWGFSPDEPRERSETISPVRVQAGNRTVEFRTSVPAA